MKNSSIISALIGGTFFAVPYLGLSLGILPSLAIGGIAFGAGELILRNSNKNKKFEDMNIDEALIEAKSTNNRIIKKAKDIEDPELVKIIEEIHGSIKSIIETIEAKPEKYKKMKNFFDYYLPVTINILEKYDEIENKRLSSDDGKEFMNSTKSMMIKINKAFKNQLSNLYQSDMIDTDAEMKVFESMLKSDGYDMEEDFKIEKDSNNK